LICRKFGNVGAIGALHIDSEETGSVVNIPIQAWMLIKDTVQSFINDNALSRGASIAYYTLFAIAPVLLIIVAIAGLALGHDAAQGAIVGQLSGLMGDAPAKAIEEMIKSAANRSAGIVASIIGVGALIVTATGVFGEVQSSMNAIWKAKPRSSTLNRLVRARLASLGLVLTSGFLLTVSLAVSAALEGLSQYLQGLFPGANVTLRVFDFLVSTTLISAMFAAIYKALPDKPITWRDVAIGAVVTTLLFDAGKYLIALYIGQSNVGSSYGAAGGLIVLLLWIYYTAQIFLFGAEFTHAYAKRFGSHAGAGEASDDGRPRMGVELPATDRRVTGRNFPRRHLMPENASAWAKAEVLARRIYELTTVPLRSQNHPTWDPKWRMAINNGLSAIGTADEPTMERALNEIDRLAQTL
jgi:membrane protein